MSATIAATFREKLTAEEAYLLDLLSPFGAVAQHSVGRYILDIAFPSRLIGIEVDGKNHWNGSRKRSDAVRDAWLVAQGWSIFRIANASTRYPGRLLALLKDRIPDLEIPSELPTQRSGPEYRVLVRDSQCPAGERR